MAIPFYGDLEIVVTAGAVEVVSDGSNSVGRYWGTGTPEGSQAAPVGSIYQDYGGSGLYLKDTGTGNTGWVQMATGTGTTNLAYTASAINGLVTSSSGTDATLPLGTTANAGLLAPSQFDKLAFVTVTQAVDLDQLEAEAANLVTLTGVASDAVDLATFTGTTISDNGTIKAGMQELETAVETKLTSTLTSANIYVGNGSNVATGVAMSGDATIANTGAITVVSASDTVAGKVELSTDAEAITGTSTTLAVTPANLDARDVTLIGTAAGQTDLDTFTGSTIGDNLSVKAAIQALETFAESIVGGLEFAGTWDATTADPSAALTNSQFYRVSVAGTTSVTTVNMGAVTDWVVGDYLFKDNLGNVHKMDNTDPATDLAIANITTTTLDVTSSTGTNATIPAATQSAAGVLASADKLKLDQTNGYVENIGGATTVTVTHTLGSINHQVQVFRVSDGAQVFPTIQRGATTDDIIFSIAPAAAAFTYVGSRTDQA